MWGLGYFNASQKAQGYTMTDISFTPVFRVRLGHGKSLGISLCLNLCSGVSYEWLLTNPPYLTLKLFIIYLISEMPAKIFNSEMEEFLEETILTGLKGRIYDVIVQRKFNQKIKI